MDGGLAKDASQMVAMDAGADAGRALPDSAASGSDSGAGPDAHASVGDATTLSPDTGSSTTCSSAGQSCESTTCCTGAICVIAPETGTSICAAQCSTPSQCNSNCCVPVRAGNTGACVPASSCTVSTGPVGGSCGALELIAEDGTYLGDATSNRFGTNSVCNQNSFHGSAFGVQSIYNAKGLYGSTFGVQSVYNTFTTTPPAIVCADSGDIIAFVTKNGFVAGATRIDPDALCVVLANAGL
jgi:hypothetical protein